MTTPPPADNTPDDAAPAWAPPDAPAEAPPTAGPPTTGGPTAGPPMTGPPMTGPPWIGPPTGGPPVAVRRRTNRFAIVALAAGVGGMVLFAVGFAVAAFVQTGRRGERGKGLAIGGLAASAAWIAAVATVAIAGPPTAGTAGPAVREDGKVAVTAMRPGDCFSEFEETPAGLYGKPLPCTTPHQGEVSAEAELPDLPYPGEREMNDRAWTLCRERTEFLERSRYGKDLQLHVAPPDKEAWKDGKRAAKCVLRYTGSGLLPTSLDQTMDTRSQYTSELSPGDCVKKWDDNGDQPLIPCTKKHEYEVLAVYTMHGDKYPGAKKMEEKALDGCAKRAVKAWGGNPPFDIATVTYAIPNKQGWIEGNRLVFCLVAGKNGPLTRSVVPH